MNTITLSDLEQFGSVGRNVTVETAPFQNPGERDFHSNTSADWSAVVAGCAFAAHCVADAAELSEPHWFALGSLLSRCEGGHRLFHEISQADARYDATETDEKFAHAGSGSAPRTCRSIREDLGFDGCGRCPMWGQA